MLVIQRLLSQLEKGRWQLGDATTKPECWLVLSLPLLALRQWVAGMVAFLPFDSIGRRQKGCSSCVWVRILFWPIFICAHFPVSVSSDLPALPLQALLSVWDNSQLLWWHYSADSVRLAGDLMNCGIKMQFWILMRFNTVQNCTKFNEIILHFFPCLCTSIAMYLFLM